MTDKQEVPEQDQEDHGVVLINQARELADKIEAANKKTEELLARQEKLGELGIVSGQSSAGAVAPTISKEQKVRDRVNKMLEGTGRSLPAQV